MKPVICVTEFSELTLEGARTAAAVARRWDEPVVLVRSVDEREQFPFELRSRLIHQDWRRLAAEAQQLRQRGFDFGEKVLRGMPEDGIAAFAWNCGARLIVVGCRPTATVEHWALGCIAEEISDTSLVPVLAVRSAAPLERWLANERPLNVFVAIDPRARPDAMLNRLDELSQLAPVVISAEIVGYPENKTAPAEPQPPAPGQHPFELDRNSRFEMSAALAARNVNLVEVPVHHDPATSLLNQAVESNIDLLIVTTHPGKDLTILPHPTLAHRLLRRAPMSVLCVPETAIESPRNTARAHLDETTAPGDLAPNRGQSSIPPNRTRL
jgi:nucleotide-binding universal stress UspA family protein